MARSGDDRRPFYCREWVYEKIHACLERRKQQEDTKTKGAFILGGPGSGKTTILRELVSPTAKEGVQVELSKKVVAHHFCQAQNALSVSVADFISSLAKQLAEAEELKAYAAKFSDPQIQNHLKSEQCIRNPDRSFKEGILLPLNALPPPQDIFLVVVDAIDESYLHSFDSGVSSGSRTVAELMATHHDLLPSWLFLVVSARKQSKTVTRMFTGFRKFTLDDLRKAHVVKDIQQYILNRLDDEPRLRKHLTRETAEAFNQLHIKSNGCLLYLEKLLDGVVDEFFSLDETQDIPGTLSGLYLWLCNRLFTEEQVEKIRSVLNVILAAQRPLTDSEMFQAVWTKDTELTTESFLETLDLMSHHILTDNNGAKSISHLSFAEWLLDVKHCTPKFLCNPADGHAMLALHYTQLSQRQQLAHPHQLAFHLSRASFREFFTQDHLALWLLWSGTQITDIQLNTDALNQEVAQLLLDAGAKVNELEEQASLLPFAPETEDSIKALLEKGTSVDRVDSAGRTLLCNAAFNGNVDVVRLLIKHGANVNFSDTSGQSPLMLASRQGHSEIVYLLVNCGATVDHCADDGCTALRAAASGGHSDVVSILLDHSAQVDLADDDKRTAMRGASWGGHSDVVLQLLQRGADPNLADKEGRTALIAAAYMGHKKVVEILLDHKAEINHPDNDGRTALAVTVLCVSASENHEAVVDLLLNRGAEVDHPDFDGITPLCVSALEGYYNVAKLLIKAGADTGHWDRNGRTPLFAAAASGHCDIVDLLLATAEDGKPDPSAWASPKFSMFRADHSGWNPLMVAANQGHKDAVVSLLGANLDINALDPDGRSALMLAAQEGHVDVVSALIEHGLPIEQASSDGRTALHFSAIEGHEACVQHLVSLGADVNHQDSLGRTPLFAVSIEENKQMVELLLDLGGFVDSKDMEGRTPLQAVAWKGAYELVELFLDRGAEINHADCEGRTALMSAAWKGHVSTVQLLIQKGAKVDKTSQEGATALCIASQEGHDEVVQILLEHDANMNHADKLGRTPMQVAYEAGHTRVTKVLEAFSVMRMNDGNFTSTLKRKLSSAQSESGSTVSNSSLTEKPQRSDSVSSSNSSESPAASRKELGVPGSTHQLGPNGEILEERRYSASFRDLHSVQPIKEPWNSACPPYTSELDVLKPPPYTEKPVRTSLVEDDVVASKPSPRGKHKQFSLLHKMKQKGKSAFTSSGSHGQEKRGKVTGKRGFFSGIKQLGASSSYSASSSKSREGKTANSKGSNESLETKI
ncbi:hypothetical protein ACROYT_G018049 [Oculina patagonica]